MDWDHGRWDSVPKPRPVPTYDDRVIWRVVKDSRWAEGRVRQVPHGHELRTLVGGQGRDEELLTSVVYRPGESAKLAEMSTGMRQTFEGRGWQILSSSTAVRQ